jgi:PKD repeat protein
MRYLPAFILIALLLLVGAAQAQPVANFTGNVTTGTLYLPVLFTDSSTGIPTGWAWFFGDETYAGPWVQKNSSSGWITRKDPLVITLINGSALISGGYNDDLSSKLNDTWVTVNNGTTWKRVNASSGWYTRSDHTGVRLPSGAVALMAGSSYVPGTGNVYKNDSWLSLTNGSQWSQKTVAAPWLGRAGARTVVLSNGTIVIMGGTYYSTGSVFLNDVWATTDNGATWTLMNSSPGWSPRSEMGVTVISGDRIVVTGGEDATNHFNDTWIGTNCGATWTRITPSAEWPARSHHGLVTMPDDSLYMIGGNLQSGDVAGDSWHSTNNTVNWTLTNSSLGSFVARYGMGITPLPSGDILMTGGVTSTYPDRNETWMLSPQGAITQNPVHNYTAPGTYSVGMTASNLTTGYNTSLKSGYITISSGVTALSMFTQDRTEVRVPNPITYTDASTGATSWDWNFGDGSANVTTQNPVHQYIWRGLYRTTLIINGGASFNTSTVRAFGYDFF